MSLHPVYPLSFSCGFCLALFSLWDPGWSHRGGKERVAECFLAPHAEGTYVSFSPFIGHSPPCRHARMHCLGREVNSYHVPRRCKEPERLSRSTYGDDFAERRSIDVWCCDGYYKEKLKMVRGVKNDRGYCSAEEGWKVCLWWVNLMRGPNGVRGPATRVCLCYSDTTKLLYLLFALKA